MFEAPDAPACLVKGKFEQHVLRTEHVSETWIYVAMSVPETDKNGSSSFFRVRSVCGHGGLSVLRKGKRA